MAKPTQTLRMTSMQHAFLSGYITATESDKPYSRLVPRVWDRLNRSHAVRESSWRITRSNGKRK